MRQSADQWINIGPDSVPNGRIAAIAVDPTNPNHWLIGAGNGGVWETRDAGATFEPLSDDWPTLAIGAVAFASSDPRIIYVGTGEADAASFEHTGIGVMKSTDGGLTWALLGSSTFARGSIKRIRVDPTNPNVVLAATTRAGFGRDATEAAPSPPPFGILTSSDGGVTWARTLAGQATALEVDPTNFRNQFAAIGDQRNPGDPLFNTSPNSEDSPGRVANGVYRSADGGQTWTLLAGPWGDSTPARAATGRIELALSPSNPNVLYASIQISPNGGTNDTSLLGLYRTDNAQAITPTWIQVPTGPTGTGGYCVGRCGYVHVISVDPADPNTLFAAGEHESIWRCNNCGAAPAWIKNTTNKHGDHHALAWAGNRLINGQDHGVWSTLDRGDNWQHHNVPTLSITTFYDGALHPTNPDVMMGAFRDLSFLAVRAKDRLWRTVVDSGSQPLTLGEAEIGISSSRPDTDWMVASGRGVIGRTTDAGRTWILADAGIDKTGAAFVAPVRKCPGNDNVFLTGTTRLWRTENFFSSAAPSWSANSPAYVTNPSSRVPPQVQGTIFSIAFDASDTNCNSYAFGNRIGQIRLTKDGGRTWIDADPGGSLPARPVNGLAFDPASPNTLFVALSSWDSATPGRGGHVFKTANALAASPSWSNISPPADEPFNVIALDPRNVSLVYAGSDHGLWRSHDGGTSWQKVGPGSGLPHASVYDIEINPVTDRTVVFTYGRGAYMLAPAQ